jgi:hypothetical protein
LLWVYLDRGVSRGMKAHIAAAEDAGVPVAFDQVFYLTTKATERERLEAILIKVIKPPQNKKLPTQVAMLAEIDAIRTFNGMDTPHAD